MKYASPDLIAALNGGQHFVLADLFTFTLANGVVARYAMADGNVTIPGNALTYSEAIDDASWSKTNCNVTANALANPADGVPTADILVDNSTNAAHCLNKSATGITAVAGQLFTLSVYVKAKELTQIRLQFVAGTSFTTDKYASFDIGAGTVLATSHAIGTIKLMQNGWYRLSIVARTDTTGTVPIQLTTMSGGLAIYVGIGSGIYLWGALCVPGAVIPPYRSTLASVVASLTFDASSIFINRSLLKSYIGVRVDSMDLTVDALPTHLLNGTAWLTACRQGALDGAALRFERLFMSAAGDISLGTMLMFTGRVSQLDIGRSQAKMTVNSDLELLNIQLPRNLFQPGCINTLYDTGCTLSKASFNATSSVATGSTNTIINCGLAQVLNYFTLGTITFTSGVLNGVNATVKFYTPGAITLLNPLIAVPGVGDTFTAYAGCDKQQATCNTKFANLAHFRGTPYVPAPESIL